MNVKVLGHGPAFEPCKGARRVQNAKVKTMEITRHDGSKFMAERARCRWCKRWMGFDLIPGEAERVERRRDMANYYSDNPSEKNRKRAAASRAKTKALVEAPCWICHTEADLGHPPKFKTVCDVVGTGAHFTVNLCDDHAVELSAKLLKSTVCSYCGYNFTGVEMYPGDDPSSAERFCRGCVNNR